MISAWWFLLVPIAGLLLLWYCGVFPPIRTVALDENQDALLRDMADIAGRAQARRTLRDLRRIARFSLTLSRLVRPRHFEAWDNARKAKP